MGKKQQGLSRAQGRECCMCKAGTTPSHAPETLFNTSTRKATNTAHPSHRNVADLPAWQPACSLDMTVGHAITLHHHLRSTQGKWHDASHPDTHLLYPGRFFQFLLSNGLPGGRVQFQCHARAFSKSWLCTHNLDEPETTCILHHSSGSNFGALTAS